MTISLMQFAFDYKNDIEAPAVPLARQTAHKDAWDAYTLENGDSEFVFLCHNASGFPGQSFEETMSNFAFEVPADLPMYQSGAPFQMDIDDFIADVYQPAVDIMGKPEVVWLLLAEEFSGAIIDYDPFLKEFQTEFLLADQGISSSCFNTNGNPEGVFEGPWLSDLLFFRQFPRESPTAPYFFPYFEQDEVTRRQYGPIIYPGAEAVGP